MKKYRKYWSNDIVKYVFIVYEHGIADYNVYNNCRLCPFYLDINIKYHPTANCQYVENNKKKIHIDNIEKKCNTCIYYYWG